VDAIPDGHVVIPEHELNNLRSQSNAYLTLKSKLPVGVPEDQVGVLAEKGGRYDPLNQQLTTAQQKVQEYENKLQQYSNMPKDFTADKWNGYVQKEAEEIFAGKMEALTNWVYEEAQKKTGIRYEVDPRFIPADVVEKFDPDASDAKEKWYQVLNDAHTAQVDFVNKIQSGAVGAGQVGAGGQPAAGGAQGGVQQVTSANRDTVGPQVLRVGHI
jgi:hypothetical protein